MRRIPSTLSLVKSQKKPPAQLVAALLFVLGVSIVLSLCLCLSRGGVNHSSNSWGWEFFSMVGIGGGLTAVMGLMLLFHTLLSFTGLSNPWRILGLTLSLVALSSPWSLFTLLFQVNTTVERRDFEKAGAGQLRQTAKTLVQTSSPGEAESDGWFGREVPPKDVPPAIRDFIPSAVRIAVNDHGVVLVTDGMGSWRGGYMIMPEGLNSAPKNSRFITDGFYYVTAR